MNVKVLVKAHKDKRFPDTFKWYHAHFIHTKMETFLSFIPLLLIDFEAANRHVQLFWSVIHPSPEVARSSQNIDYGCDGKISEGSRT